MRPGSRLAAALAAAAVLAACSSSWPIKNDPPRGTNVIAFGDSLTEGYRMKPGDGWPEQLAVILGIPILNMGVSGNTTADGLARLDTDVLEQDPRVVMVCLGGNDMLRRMSADEQFANLRQIVQRIQEKDALVVLVGTEGFQLLSNVDYGARYEALARETGAVYVPDLMDDVLGDHTMMHDQIHPSAKGYAHIARRIADEAGEYIRR